MSEAVIVNGKLWIAQYDLSGEMNAIAAEMSAEAPESTAMAGTGIKARKPDLAVWWIRKSPSMASLILNKSFSIPWGCQTQV